MDNDGKGLSNGKRLSLREKVSLSVITAGAGLLGGFVIWSFPAHAHVLCSVIVMLLLWFLGPGTWFALFGRFDVRGPDRAAFIKSSASLLNLTAIISAAALFWLLSFWRPPWN
jgi:hypothetical protein